MKLSIAIPTCEYNGKGSEYLDDLLRTIEIQTFKDVEIVVSDNCIDPAIRNKCEEFTNLNIVYFNNAHTKGNSPANLNNAISLCSGEIIKVMFQDDFFYDDEALEKIYYNLSGDPVKQWLVCGTNHTQDHGNTFFWDFYPRNNDNLINGVNTISSPSVLAFKKNTDVSFDENLVYLMDTDFYCAMFHRYGDPIYYDDVLVSNRMHENSISHNIKNKEEMILKESAYCRKKYD
jgi:glycosyltransferase involved in cell wall biosynthesis